MIDYNYVIRTADGKKYDYYTRNKTLTSIYKDVMSNDYIEANKWAKNTKVVINTKHIVSIERW